MYELAKLRLRDTIECAAHVRKIGSSAVDAADMFTRLARFFYEALLDVEGRPACPLVRVYKTCPLRTLDAARAAFAASLCDGGAPDPETACMTLVATAGELPSWGSVEGSKGHQAIPLSSPTSLDRLPMIAGLIDHLGLDRAAVIRPDPAGLGAVTQTAYDVFHVAEAVGSPLIPAQQDFVIPYGVRSVVGFGGVSSSGELLVVLLFSRVPIGAEVAAMFKLLALSVRLAMMPFADRSLFAQQAPVAEGGPSGGPRVAALREELEMTRLVVAELERVSGQQEARLERLIHDLSSGTGVLAATIDGIADAVAVVDETGTFTRLNTAAEQFLGPARDSGELDRWRTAGGIFHPDMVTPFTAEDLPLARALRGEPVERVEMYIPHPSQPQGMWLLVSVKPIRVDGVDRGAVIILRDITDRKVWEHEMERQLVREKERSELLERMKDAIQVLSTPILEVWDDVLAVPLIGVMDSMRAAEMMERVLGEVERKQCRYLILDITGVDVIDTATADRLAKLVTAVEILGAQCFLTGARAVVAQTMASLGVDLGRLTTLRTLKHALAECMRLTAAGAARPRLEELLSGRSGRRE